MGRAEIQEGSKLDEKKQGGSSGHKYLSVKLKTPDVIGTPDKSWEQREPTSMPSVGPTKQ